MLYEELKRIENLLEGDEYSESGVTYYFAADKIDDTVSFDIALKNISMNIYQKAV